MKIWNKNRSVPAETYVVSQAYDLSFARESRLQQQSVVLVMATWFLVSMLSNIAAV